jgi:uncharacterized paraquat-inducible protein A
MKPLHTARHAADAYLVHGYLESQGIHAVVRGEYLTSGIGDLPADVCTVWIVDDQTYAQADELLRQFLHGEAAREHAHEHWHCSYCHEAIEGQFTDCWRCGAARPG